MLMVAYAVAGLTGCSGDNNTIAPSPTAQIIDSSVTLSANAIAAIQLQIERQRTLTGSVDWIDFSNDIDVVFFPGPCTADLFLVGQPGCRDDDALFVDTSRDKPSEWITSVTPGVHTLLMINYGFRADTLFYRLVIDD